MTTLTHRKVTVSQPGLDELRWVINKGTGTTFTISAACCDEMAAAFAAGVPVSDPAGEQPPTQEPGHVDQYADVGSTPLGHVNVGAITPGYVIAIAFHQATPGTPGSCSLQLAYGAGDAIEWDLCLSRTAGDFSGVPPYIRGGMNPSLAWYVGPDEQHAGAYPLITPGDTWYINYRAKGSMPNAIIYMRCP